MVTRKDPQSITGEVECICERWRQGERSTDSDKGIYPLPEFKITNVSIPYTHCELLLACLSTFAIVKCCCYISRFQWNLVEQQNGQLIALVWFSAVRLLTFTRQHQK